MRVVSKWLVWGALASAAAASGCASKADAEAAQMAQAGLTEDGPDAAPLQFIRSALAKVSLRADQQSAVQALTQDATARHEQIRQARLALRTQVAAQVQAGKIDRAALQPSIDALAATVDKVHPLDRAAFVKLHDLLDKTQRGQFVDALEAEFHAHGGPGGPGGGRGGGGPGQKLHQLGTDLNLTTEQRQQIGSAMRAQFEAHRPPGGPEGGPGRDGWRAAREHGQKMLASFREDQFAFDESPLFGRDHIAHGIDHMIGLAEVAVPILTPEQRAIAAQKIRTGLNVP